MARLVRAGQTAAAPSPALRYAHSGKTPRRSGREPAQLVAVTSRVECRRHVRVQADVDRVLAGRLDVAVQLDDPLVNVGPPAA